MPKAIELLTFGLWPSFDIRHWEFDISPSARRERPETIQGRDACGQASKGVWGMSRRQEAMKGVEDCDKLGGMVKRVLIPRFPNDPKLNP